jgi:hypothetical protein
MYFGIDAQTRRLMWGKGVEGCDGRRGARLGDRRPWDARVRWGIEVRTT